MSFFILLTSVVHCKLQLRVFSFNTKRYERLYVICFAIYEKNESITGYCNIHVDVGNVLFYLFFKAKCRNFKRHIKKINICSFRSILSFNTLGNNL